jgi:hypothetical protein
MKVTVDFENGMQLTLKPENIQLIDNGGRETVAITRTDNTIIPIVFFKGVLLATTDELKAREEKAKADAAAAKAVAAANDVSKAPAAPAPTPAPEPIDSATQPQ